MTTPPCPTCRHYVLHGRLMHHVTVGRRIRHRYAEHRASIHDLALHLTEHAEEAAA